MAKTGPLASVVATISGRCRPAPGCRDKAVVAKDPPEHVQHLIGYKLHGSFLGWVEGHDPHIVLEDRYSDVMPASSEGGEATEETQMLKTATLGDPRFITLG